MNSGLATLVAIFALLIGLATVAVLVSQSAQTSSVIKALTSGGSALIGAAVAPVTGGGSGNPFGSLSAPGLTSG
jgi:hypothetical protein